MMAFGETATEKSWKSSTRPLQQKAGSMMREGRKEGRKAEDWREDSDENNSAIQIRTGPVLSTGRCVMFEFGMYGWVPVVWISPRRFFKLATFEFCTAHFVDQKLA